MSVDASQLERSALEAKDRDELATIAIAMGGKPASRARKGDIIDQILELAGVTGSSGDGGNGAKDDQLSLTDLAPPAEDATERPRGNGSASRARGRKVDDAEEGDAVDQDDQADDAKAEQAEGSGDAKAGDTSGRDRDRGAKADDADERATTGSDGDGWSVMAGAPSSRIGPVRAVGRCIVCGTTAVSMRQ